MIKRDFSNRGQVLLTTGVDTVVGTTATEVITGSISNLGGTFTAADKIDGSTGRDTLLLTQAISFTGLSTGFVKNVETVKITNSAATGVTATTFDAKNFSGVESLVISSPGASFTLSSVPTGLKSLSFDGGSQGRNLTTTYETTAAERQATTTAIDLNLSSVGRVNPADATGATLDRGTLNIGDVQTLNVGVTGKNYVTFDGAVRAVVASGEGELNANLVANYANLTTFDASGVKGEVRVDLTNSNVNGQITSVKTGAGNDRITLAREDLSQTATISGGVGTDSLTLTSVNGNAPQIVQYSMSGIQTLNFTTVTGDAAADTLTFTASSVSDLSTVTTSSLTVRGVVLAGLTGDLTLNALGVTNVLGPVSSDHAGSTTINFKQSNAAAIAAKTQQTAAAGYTLSESKGLTVNVEPYVVAGATGKASDAAVIVSAAKATSVNFNVASGKSAAGLEQTFLAGVHNLPSATTITMDIQGGVIAPRLVAPEATSITIKNGTVGAVSNVADSGEIIIDTGTGVANTPASKLKTLSIESGAALKVYGLGYATTNASADLHPRSFAEVQTLTIAANKGAVELLTRATSTDSSAVLAKVNTLALSGTASDSSITLGALGGDNGYGLTLTSTGLKADITGTSAFGLQVGNMTVSTGQPVTLNLAGTSGLIKVGTIGGVSGSNAGAVTINAAGVGSNNSTGEAIEIGAITSSGAVNIDVSGTRNPDIGAITGKSIKVNLSGVTAPTVELGGGTLNATDSVDLSLYNLRTNTLTINGNNSTIGFNASVEGGALVDNLTFNLNGTATNAVTIVGDLKGGNDLVAVNATGSVAKRIDISGLASYDSATLVGGAGADTMIGGSGSDVFYAGAGANVLTGNGGADIFVFGTGTTSSRLSNTGGEASITRITDFSQNDRIAFADVNIAAAANLSETAALTGDATGATGKVTIATGGVSFSGAASGFDTLTKKVSLIEEALDVVGSAQGKLAFFLHEGTVHAFVSAGTATDGSDYLDAVVVQLTGLTTLPGVALAAPTSEPVTGLSGFGLAV